MATSTAAPVPAAQQVAVVVSQLVSRAGAHRMVLQLQPEDLGRIQVSIERTATGATHVALTADRPETLRVLLRDHAEIARALDRAGVPADQRTVTLAAAVPAVTPPATRPEAAHDAAPGFNQASGQAQGQGQGQGQPNQPQDRGARQHLAGGSFSNGSPAALDDHPAGRWLRRGFDITA